MKVRALHAGTKNVSYMVCLGVFPVLTSQCTVVAVVTGKPLVAVIWLSYVTLTKGICQL